jgi:hypothetical protein
VIIEAMLCVDTADEMQANVTVLHGIESGNPAVIAASLAILLVLHS